MTTQLCILLNLPPLHQQAEKFFNQNVRRNPQSPSHYPSSMHPPGLKPGE